MSDIEIYEGTVEEDYDDQIRDALNKSLEIYGTVMNDLEYAINTAIQYQRAYKMLQAPDPNEAAMKYLLEKYKMARDEQTKTLNSVKSLLSTPRKELDA